MSHFARYLARRIVSAALLIFIVMTLNFFIIHSAPGDPVTIMTGIEQPSKEIVETLKKKYGLDEPIFVQYVKYITNLFKGDLGYSYVYDQSSWSLIKERILPTLILTLSGSILAFILGVFLAIFVSHLRTKFGDTIVSIISYILYATPSFWLGLIMILVFSSKLSWFPTSGMYNLRETYTGFKKILDFLHHLTLPVLTLMLIQMPVFYRVTRASIIQNYKEDYVTTLTAIGVPKRKLFRKYIVKNSIIPPLTIFGITLGFSITGAALIEIVFAWPGMGRLMLDAIFRRDYQLLLGIYFLMAIFISVAMILTDIVIAFIDPRIRLT
ncbi:MAG: peptide/nickel transport system permease protein [Pseudothermotoga sp.]|jgi:peptide/nickel transport system permease protein|nr:peptide/nickel transport system permease protein [Pseudothermotoga sp.]